MHPADEIRELPQARTPRGFIADAMLGRLARWLRILGYDTAYEKIIPDHDLVERVQRENRWLLTRDSYLAKRKILRGRHTLIRSDYAAEQLRQLSAELRLNLRLDEETASRCPACNLVLEPVTREEAAPRVPPFVAQQHAHFTRCAKCARVYWPGTHWAHLRAQLERLRAQ